jgi:hypothetical protein
MTSRLQVDQRLVDAACDILKGGSAKVHKSTRSGATTSLIIAARKMGKRILCVEPTKRISQETIQKASNGNAVAVHANSDCIMLKDDIGNDRFLEKLPLPLPDCNDCNYFGTCPVTEILKSSDPVITITYSKLMALMLSKSEIAREILKRMSSAEIVLLDEADTSSLPAIVRVPVFSKVEVPADYRNLFRVFKRWLGLNEDNRKIIDDLKRDGDKAHAGKYLSRRVNNREQLSFKQISVAWNELVRLAKNRKQLCIQEKDILLLRDIISLMSNFMLAITYIGAGKGSEGNVYLTGNYWIRIGSLRDFLTKYASKATHLYVSGTMVEPSPNFFADLSGKPVKDAIFPDFRNTNDKMSIQPDTWKLNSNNFSKKQNEIVNRIVEIRNKHPEEDLYVVTMNARTSGMIKQKLDDQTKQWAWKGTIGFA